MEAVLFEEKNITTETVNSCRCWRPSRVLNWMKYNIQNVWFQNGGTTAHTTLHLREVFPGHLILFRGDISWPAWSHELEPMWLIPLGPPKIKGIPAMPSHY